ncbi:MAG: discoidin domain-containing protein [Nostoc sp.]|uniref:discoidin domain-containing protein n=1 Tax=Nostoc sp. TaxID=1180 RepID=UPI002FF0F442
MPQIKDIAITKTIADDDDLLVMQNPTTGETYNIKKSDFLAGFSGSTPSTPTGHSLTYASDGDSNGLFYYLGTGKGATTWSNPASVSVLVSSSSAGYGDPSILINTQADRFWTGDAANSWVMFQFAGKLTCNYYSIKSRSNDSGHYPRTWKLQGSNDSISWTDVDTQTNNETLVNASQWLSIPVTSTVGYSSFRLIQVGANSSGYGYLCLDEVELYGLYAS